MTFTTADTTADTMTVTIVTLAGGYDTDYDGGYDRNPQAILAITIVTAPIVTAKRVFENWRIRSSYLPEILKIWPEYAHFFSFLAHFGQFWPI